MNVSLTPRLEAIIQEKVDSGLYNNASEVIREALRLLVEQDRRKEMELQRLRDEIQIGIDDIERGDYSETTAWEIAKELQKENRKQEA